MVSFLLLLFVVSWRQGEPKAQGREKNAHPLTFSMDAGGGIQKLGGRKKIQ